MSNIDFTPRAPQGQGDHPVQSAGPLTGTQPMQGFAPPPPRGGSGRNGTGGGRRGALLGLAVLAVAGVVAAAVLSGTVALPSDSQPGEATSPYLVLPGIPVAKTACVDSSASVDKDGRLATMASAAIVGALDALPAWPETPHTWEPTAATPVTTLSARVVRRDSYSTREAGEYVATAEIDAVHGLSEAKPGGDDPDASSDWADAAVTVGRDATAANAALKTARAELKAVLKGHSNGSDVIGCVGAALEATTPGTAVDVLVVSDLIDRTLKNPDGTNRGFKGDFAGARVLIVQACPSGDQARCRQTGEDFTRRLNKLGITDVQMFRPEELDAGVTSWLSPRPA